MALGEETKKGSPRKVAGRVGAREAPCIVGLIRGPSAGRQGQGDQCSGQMPGEMDALKGDLSETGEGQVPRGVGAPKT